MAAKHVKMKPKSGQPESVGTPIQLVAPGPITLILDPIDADGDDVPVMDPANHQGTLTVDNTAAFVITPGPDSLHYSAVVPKGTPPSTTVTLTGTDHAVDGSFPDLSATQVLITPVAPLPADLKIVVSIGP